MPSIGQIPGDETPSSAQDRANQAAGELAGAAAGAGPVGPDDGGPFIF
jgi:hypothetical protein